MFSWFKKNKAPAVGPDFSSVDSMGKAGKLAQLGQLEKILLLPEEFGGDDVPANWAFVPAWVAEKKASIDQDVILPLASEGKVSRYSASPQYQGKSFIPNAIKITASDPGSFETIIGIWGDALDENRNGNE